MTHVKWPSAERCVGASRIWRGRRDTSAKRCDKIFRRSVRGKTDVTDHPSVSEDTLINDIRKLGIESEGLVLLHSSLKSLGWVESGPEAAIHAFLTPSERAATGISMGEMIRLRDPCHRNPQKPRRSRWKTRILCVPAGPLSRRQGSARMGRSVSERSGLQDSVMNNEAEKCWGNLKMCGRVMNTR